MTFEDLASPIVMGPMLGGIFSVIGGLNILFIRWLDRRFETLGINLKENVASFTNWLKDHEEKDQDRHIENLYRFEKISVALAKLGSTNGTYNKELN